MFDIVYQYFHIPTTGAGWAAWFFFIYACLGDAMPFMKRIVPNGPLQMILMMLSAGMKAITINKDAGIVTIDLKALEDSGVPGDTNISVINSGSGKSAGVDTAVKPSPLADLPDSAQTG